jgi:hypothetical protein
MRELSFRMSGFGAALYDFDNDGWKDLFVSRGHALSRPLSGTKIDEYNTVFRNPGPSGKWTSLTEEAGLTASPPARHRGCAFGDLYGDGRVDVVVTALGRNAEIWRNRTQKGTLHPVTALCISVLVRMIRRGRSRLIGPPASFSRSRMWHRTES